MKRVLVCLVFLVASFAVLPAMAQNTTTVTVTEAQINSGWRVTTSPRLRVSNVTVDLQPGQAVISATLKPSRGSASYAAQMTVSPSMSEGKVTWTVVSVAVDGKTASGTQSTQVSTALLDSWQNYVKTDVGPRSITAVTITNDDITYTLTGGAVGGTVTVDTSLVTATLTESTINSSWRIVTTPRLRVTNAAVDLQPNQAVISATLTPKSGTAYSAQLTVTPTVSGGKVTWTALSAAINGVAASGDQLTQINNILLKSWVNYISTEYGKKTITAVTITDTAITYSASK